MCLQLLGHHQQDGFSSIFPGSFVSCPYVLTKVFLICGDSSLFCVWIGVCVIRNPPGGDLCDCIVHVIFGVPLNYLDECVHYFFAWELNFFKQKWLKKYVFLPQNIDLNWIKSLPCHSSVNSLASQGWNISSIFFSSGRNWFIGEDQLCTVASVTLSLQPEFTACVHYSL